MIETYFALKIGVALIVAGIMAIAVAICAVKKIVEVIALAYKKKRRKKGGRR